MKKLIVALAVVAVVGGAQADIFANLGVGFGIGGEGSAGGIVNPIDGTPVSLVVINGGGDGLDYVVPGQVAITGVSGNDLVIGAPLFAVVTGGGADFSDWAATIGGVVQDKWADDTWIRISGFAVNDWVYEQAITFADLDTSDPKVLPESLFFDNGGAGGAADGSITVIPEPATFGLLGVAALGMFLARKKARR